MPCLITPRSASKRLREKKTTKKAKTCNNVKLQIDKTLITQI